jgi:hypothetical protein
LSIITKNAHFAVIAWITWIFMVLIYWKKVNKIKIN